MPRKISGADHWAPAVPCTRHGEAGVEDPRLVELLNAAQLRIDANLAAHLRSLNAFNGQLWVTWKDDASRATFARIIDQSWRALDETGPTIHLIPLDESYDYQEDVMNNADGD
jgi:hypothetical protein